MKDKIDNLTWEPHIGKNYNKLGKEDRLLIVGESHYLAQNDQGIEEANNSNFTQITIGNFGYNSKNRFFTNIRKIVLGQKADNPSLLWDNCAFYNFIQRPMKDAKERPTKQDFIEGWNVFFELVKELQPSLVLFAGSTAANVLHDNKSTLMSADRNFERVKWIYKIGRNYMKQVDFNFNGSESLQVVCTLHPSKCPNTKSWHDYFIKQSKGKLNYLHNL